MAAGEGNDVAQDVAPVAGEVTWGGFGLAGLFGVDGDEEFGAVEELVFSGVRVGVEEDGLVGFVVLVAADSDAFGLE